MTSATAASAPARPPRPARLRRPELVALCLLIAAYVSIRLWNLTTFCLDSDEIFSLLCARFDLGHLLHAVSVDVVHPPLSYLLLWLWIRIGGESLVWMRLLPFAISVLALGPVWIFFRQLELSPPAWIIALGLLSINDYQVFHARYVRMYALLFLLSIASVAVFNTLLAGVTKRRAIALTAVNLLLVYSHYYGWMVVGVEGLYLLLMDRRKLKPFLLGTLFVAVLFAPWALVATHAAIAKGGLAPNLGWIRHPKFGDLWWYYAGCNGPLWPVPVTSAMILVVFGVLAASLWRVFRAAQDPLLRGRLRFAALMAVFPPVVTYFLSNLLRNSVWGNRHLIVSTVPYLALLASALIALRPKWVRVIVITILAAWGLWGAYRVTMRPELRNNMDALTGQLVDLEEREGPHSGPVSVYCLDPYLSFSMRYFLESHYGRKWNLVDVPDVSAISGDRVWVAYNYKSWKGARHPQELLRALGYEIGPGIWSGDHWDRIAIFLAYRKRN
jgi:uncharacterized membrane protein